MRRAFVAVAVVVLAAVVVGAAAGVQYESRSLTASKKALGHGKYTLTLKLSSAHAISGCYAGAPLTLQRRKPNGTWVTIKRGETSASGLLSWPVVGVKAQHRAVAPQTGATATSPGRKKVLCRKVILGFDKGYLSP